MAVGASLLFVLDTAATELQADGDLVDSIWGEIEEGDETAIRKLTALGHEASLNELAKAIVRFGRQPERKSNPEFLKEAIAATRSIPGHAEYFGRQIEGLSDQAFSADKRRRHFDILRAIGSDESLGILAQFLHDDRGWDEDEEALKRMILNGYSPGANWQIAVGSLLRMELPNPPDFTNSERRVSKHTRGILIDWHESQERPGKGVGVELGGVGSRDPKINDQGLEPPQEEPELTPGSSSSSTLFLALGALAVVLLVGGGVIWRKSRV